jgi:hypothetical protein
MFLFDGTSPIRQALTFLVKHPTYRYVSIITLSLYVVLLCVRSSIPQTVATPLFLAFDCLFFIDMLLNILVYGFVGKYAYLDNGVHVLDLLINILVVVNIITYRNMLYRPALNRVIPAVRACRIMRVTNYSHSLMVLKISLASSGKDIIRLLLFLLVFLLLAGSISVRLFKSSTYTCNLTMYTKQ